MRICPSLVLILSLAACEHASTATQPSTLPAEVGVVEPKAATPEPAPAPTPAQPEAAPPETAPPAAPAPAAVPAAAPAAAMVAPKPEPAARTVAPAAKPSLLGKDCTQYRQTRAAPKWNADCERPRVTKKPTAGDPAPAALPKAAQP